MGYFQNIQEKYRWIRPLFASLIVVVCFVVVVLLGKGYDHLFGVSYPFDVYPLLEGVTVGNFIILCISVAFIVAIISFQLARWFNENKPNA